MLLFQFFRSLRSRQPEHPAAAGPHSGETEHAMDVLIDAVPDFIQLKDGEGRWQRANTFVLSLFGLHDDWYIGRKDDEIAGYYGICGETLLKCSSRDEEAWNTGEVIRYEERLTPTGGQTGIYEMIKIPVFNPDGSRNGLVTVGRDITERKRAEQLNHYLAYHDSLTKLPNRSSFKEHLKGAILEARSRQSKLAVIYMDMDRFKYINDSLGHSVGDLLLGQIAERLNRCLDGKGTLYRLGGDEFAMLLPRIEGPGDAVEIAKRAITAIDRMFIVDEYELYITTSAGISFYPNDGEDAMSLMRYADTALYRAKEQGKNNYQIYHSSMNIQTYKTFMLEKDLRRALSREELELYYQPRLDTGTGQIIGMEALIRWNHPEWGLVSPVEFIPLAEETGLIAAIGEWVIDSACTQNKTWQEQGLPNVPVSVNISAHQFMCKEFHASIERMLAVAGLSPQWLELEITENIVMDNDQPVIQTVQSLQKLGVSIALDDFGTGYSSLSYLKSFKVNTIKIDKTFIRDLTLDSEEYFIIKSIVQMVKSLHIRVVAEGVEEEAQLRILRSLGCDQVQGYLFSKPVPAARMGELLRRGTISRQPAQDGTGRPAGNHRQYFRVPFPYGLSSGMTIVQIGSKRLELGRTEVLIEDIGLGGLRFLSVVKLPVNPEILIEFETTLLGRTVAFKGIVVWKQELPGDHLFQYGFKFMIDEAGQAALSRLLNALTFAFKKSPLPDGCSWIQTDKLHYLKSYMDKSGDGVQA
ncbi:EAL domain-containing protein [Paenibacillus sp. N4]|uniref:EAL domain-containing protein n=1 Tax=Paenibacillus vietnamensis TaxID=2590547 RepID=UPI001CD0FDC6|nr:EAL domain-containing protein [Paenibacillus vietnamensis]MCA0756277.1 EAL domain-containing protein [Paenibacillus vietnamensis]